MYIKIFVLSLVCNCLCLMGSANTFDKGEKFQDSRGEPRLMPIGAIGSKAFYFFNQDMFWGDAAQLCHESGMSMAALENAEESDLVQNWMLTNRWWYAWLAGTDLFKNKGNWYWLTNGRSFNFTNWGLGYPKGELNRSCLELWVSQTDPSFTGWQDYTCGLSGKSKPLCQLQ